MSKLLQLTVTLLVNVDDELDQRLQQGDDTAWEDVESRIYNGAAAPQEFEVQRVQLEDVSDVINIDETGVTRAKL
jgi:hypothetical protein